jgi:hypothetical protein
VDADAVAIRGNEADVDSSGAASAGAVAAASMGAVSVDRAGVPEVAAGEWVAEASSKEECLFESIRLT